MLLPFRKPNLKWHNERERQTSVEYNNIITLLYNSYKYVMSSFISHINSSVFLQLIHLHNRHAEILLILQKNNNKQQ